MERMISGDLIKSVERNRGALNAAYGYYSQAGYSIEASDALNIFHSVLNPLFDEGLTVQDRTVLSVFKSILKLLSKNLIGSKGRYSDIEPHFFKIISKQKLLLSGHGGVFLLNVFNALLNLNDKKIPSIGKWADIISSLNPATDIETFRKAGFVLAWRCGAASIRESAAEHMKLLSSDILNLIFETELIDDTTRNTLYEAIWNSPWDDPVSLLQAGAINSPVFKYAGGFSGFGSVFSSLPAAASIDDSIYATDGETVFRLYSDYYGVELIRDKTVEPENIRPGGVINRYLKDGKFILNNKNYPLPEGWKEGVSSIAVNRHSVVWTLHDSYKLYIIGFRNTHDGK